jgi:3-carboxy-cis,cis-muconate cycloisomerase
MRENIARSNYLILAEALVQALSAEIPRTEAHARVKDACAVAASKDLSLIEIVKKQYGEIAPGNKIDWDALAKPENYLGQAEQFIDRVLEQVRNIDPVN